MNLFFMARRYIYPIISVLAPCVIYQVVLFVKRNERAKISKPNLLWRYIFLLYLSMVMWAVGLGSIWDIAAYGFNIQWNQINLIPFKTEAAMTYILNIIMFMPMGFLLPLIWSKCRTMLHTVLAGFLFSLSIELGQIINHRLTDIDDILMNVLGTALGFGAWFLFDKLFKTNPKEKNIFPDKPQMYLALAILGNLFLYNWRLSVMMYR